MQTIIAESETFPEFLKARLDALLDEQVQLLGLMSQCPVPDGVYERFERVNRRLDSVSAAKALFSQWERLA